MSKKYVSVLKDSAATPGYRIIAPEDYVYTENGTKKVKKIDSKADKKVPATAGNLATLDATGNLADSGKQTTDFMNALPTAYEASGSATKTVTQVTQATTGAVAVTYSDIQSGTTSQKGLVQLEDSTSSTSTVKAATPNSVKSAYDLASGKYSKPSGGIPSSDMDSAVQASLGKADTAIQGVKLNGSTLTPSSVKVVDLGNLKTTQAAVSDPSASGTTLTAIDTISQDANGVITATKKTIQTASQSQAGVMSATDKTKLDGIATGAEVNQNAFSNVKVGDVTVAADAKTDTLTLVAGSNVTITPDATNDQITIAASDTTYTADAGITLDGTVFKHTNSVSGGTVGPTTDTAGATLSVPYVTYDSQGHVTASGTRTHNVGTASTSGAGIVQLQDSIDATTTKAATPNAVKNAIEALDVASVGGDGKYISAISETDGKISATSTTMDTTPTASSDKAVTSGGVKSALDLKADADSVIAIADSTVTRSHSSEWFKVAEYTYSNTSGFVWNGTWMTTLNGTNSDRVLFGGMTFIMRFAANFSNTSSAPSLLSFSTSPIDESLKSLINNIKFKLVFDISGSATIAKLYYSPGMEYCMLALREVMGGIGNTSNVKSLWTYTSYDSSTAGESTEPVGNSANITMTWTYATTSTVSIPTKLSDLTDDITQQTYIASGTDSDKPASGAAVAQAILGKLSVYDGAVASGGSGSSRWSKVADYWASNNTQAAGIWIVTYGTEFANGDNPRQDFALLSVNFRGDSTSTPVMQCVNLTTFYSWDASTYAISVVTRGRSVELWAKNDGNYRAIQFTQILCGRGGNTDRWKYYATSFTDKPVEDPSNGIYVYDAVTRNSRDASWINSGTFDAARIPTITPSMVESGGLYPIATTGLNAYIGKSATGYGKEDLVIAKIIKMASTSHSGITLLVTQGDNYGGAENQGIYIIQAAYRGSASLVVTKIREGKNFSGVWYYMDNDYMYVVYRRADYSGRISVSLMGRMTNADTASEIAPSGVTLTEATYRELAVANGSYPNMSVGDATTASTLKKYYLGVTNDKVWRKVCAWTVGQWNSCAAVLRIYNRGYAVKDLSAAYYGTLVCNIYRGNDTETYSTYRNLFVDNGIFSTMGGVWDARLVWTGNNDLELWICCSSNSNSACYTIEYASGTIGEPIGDPLSTSEFNTYVSGKSTLSPTYSVAPDGTYNNMRVGVANYPAGFSERSASWTWGTLTTGNGYTQITSWHTSNGSDIAFAEKSGAVSVQIDGKFYQSEGANRVLDTADVSVPSTVPTLAWNTESTLATIDGKNIKVKLPGSPDTDTKQNIILATTTKAFITGVSTTPTSTAQALTGLADTGVYLTTTAGELNATQYKVNEHCTMKYNSTKSSLDFTFS